MADRTAPPGWYDDPENAGTQRYWDGQAWTPATPPPPPSTTAIPTASAPANTPRTAPIPTTNGLAVASLVLGILWVWWLGSLLAVVFGHVAKSQMSRPGNHQQGAGFATAGLVLGYLGIAALILVIAIAAAAA